MKHEEWTRQIPEEKIEYGYTLRDYRKSGGGLRWSWATEYRHGDDLLTDYNYSFSRITAIISARISLVVLAFKMGARKK